MNVTRAELARIFGVSPPAVDGWVRRGCPVKEPSRGPGRGRGAKFWTPDVIAWYCQHTGTQSTGDAAASETRREYRDRLLRIQVENAEWDLAIKSSQLLTTDQFREAVTDAFGRVAGRIKSLPPKLARAAVGVESPVDGLMRMEPIIEQLLEELSSADDVVPTAPEDLSDDP